MSNLVTNFNIVFHVYPNERKRPKYKAVTVVRGATFAGILEQLGGESLHLIETAPVSTMRQQLEAMTDDLGMANEEWLLGSRLLLNMEDLQSQVVRSSVAEVIVTKQDEKLLYDKKVLSEQEVKAMQFKLRCMYRGKAFKVREAKKMGIEYKQTKSFIDKGRGLHGLVNRVRTFNAMMREVNGSVPAGLNTMYYHDSNFSEAEKLCPGWIEFVTKKYRSVRGSMLDIPTTSAMARAKIRQCKDAQDAGEPIPAPDCEPDVGHNKSPSSKATKKRSRPDDDFDEDSEQPKSKVYVVGDRRAERKKPARLVHHIMFLDINVCALLDEQKPDSYNGEEFTLHKPNVLTNAAMLNILRSRGVPANSTETHVQLFKKVATLYSKCYHHMCDASAFECPEVEEVIADM